MNSKQLLNSSWGQSHQGNGISQQLEDEIYLFDAFMDAKGGNSGGKNPHNNNDDPVNEPVLTDVYTSGNEFVADNMEYNIRIEFYGEWTDTLKEDLIKSADFISSLITNDIAPEGKDDLTITATLIEIDGSGGILGRAGPTHIWTANNLSSQAVMEFDIADATNFDSLDLWDDIILHEMLHSVGFGTLWDNLNLVDTVVIDDNGTKKPVDDILSTIFTGENAIFYEPTGNPYPLVETDGGAGTAGGHWDEDTYDNELMTGYIDDPNYLSMMSYGALDDMGYDINYAVNVDFWLA